MVFVAKFDVQIKLWSRFFWCDFRVKFDSKWLVLPPGAQNSAKWSTEKDAVKWLTCATPKKKSLVSSRSFFLKITWFSWRLWFRKVPVCAMSVMTHKYTVLSRGVRSLFGPTRKSSPWGNFSDGGLNQAIKRRLRLYTFRLIDWLTIS